MSSSEYSSSSSNESLKPGTPSKRCRRETHIWKSELEASATLFMIFSEGATSPLWGVPALAGGMAGLEVLGTLKRVLWVVPWVVSLAQDEGCDWMLWLEEVWAFDCTRGLW